VHNVSEKGLVGYWQFGAICDPRDLVANPPSSAPSSANGVDARDWPISTFMAQQQSIGGHNTTWWQFNFCGDGHVCNEECDDGNDINTDSCLCNCKNATCGDGFLEIGVEECDLGPNNSEFGSCLANCTNSTCGDGFLQAGVEECDLGQNNSFNGVCLPNCMNATCGDGFIAQGLEECDNGVVNNSDTGLCTTLCKNATCGDRFVQTIIGEECDDGNLNNTDACNNSCVCNPPTDFQINYWLKVNEQLKYQFFAPCTPVNCTISRVPQTITASMQQNLSCDVSTIDLATQQLTFTPNTPGRYVLTLSDPTDNNRQFGSIFVASIEGNGVFAEGRCSGADCCNLVKACIIDLKSNQIQLNSTIAAQWSVEDLLCPFPICADGYIWDDRVNGGTCIRYIDPSSPPLSHVPYNSIQDCLSDFSRRGNNGHCHLPLSKAWRYCKKGVGLY